MNECKNCCEPIAKNNTYCSDCFDIIHHAGAKALPINQGGSKFDEDLYSKFDLSLIPFEILSKDYNPESKIFAVSQWVHKYLNNDEELSVSLKDFFLHTCGKIGVEKLAVALGYGEIKYGRDNWKKGFGGDWRRFLKAVLRHCHDILQYSKTHDGEEEEGYHLGNHHESAILFGLMVACYEKGEIK